jgi:hypothetical protein
VGAGQRRGDLHQAQPVAQRHALGPAARRGDGDDAAVPAGVEELAGQRVVAVRRQPGVVDPHHARVLGHRGGDGERAVAVPLHPQRQGGQAALQQEGLVRGEHPAEVDPVGAHPRHQLRGADRDAAGAVAVAAEVLGGRLHHDVDAVLQRADDGRGGERRVDDQLRPGVVRDAARPGRSATDSVGLASVSAQTTAVSGRTAARTSSRSCRPRRWSTPRSAAARR